MTGITFIVIIQSVFWLGKGQESNTFEQSKKLGRLPQLDVCGKSIHPPGEKVIKGIPTGLGEFPWMAALRYRYHDTNYTMWACGGSLITDEYVITAAHCLHPDTITSYTLDIVRLGELDLNETVADGASPLDFRVLSWIIHPEYSDLTKENDISLVKLDRKVTFTNYIRPICFPSPKFVYNEYVGCPATIAGWGRTLKTTKERVDTRLLKGDVVIKDRGECRINNTRIKKLANAIIDDRVICASGDQVDSCKGDSGGPLMKYIRPEGTSPGVNGNTYLMGIVSYGYKCADQGYPGVYTRVSKYMTWIIENLDI